MTLGKILNENTEAREAISSLFLEAGKFFDPSEFDKEFVKIFKPIYDKYEKKDFFGHKALRKIYIDNYNNATMEQKAKLPAQGINTAEEFAKAKLDLEKMKAYRNWYDLYNAIKSKNIDVILSKAGSKRNEISRELFGAVTGIKGVKSMSDKAFRPLVQEWVSTNENYIPESILIEGEMPEEYAETISKRLGLRSKFVLDFMKKNDIDGYKLLTIMTGRKPKMQPLDVATALIGTPNNTYYKKLMKLLGK